MQTETDVVRAWKDPAYRAALSDAERSALPTNPAGMMELTDAELMETNGGTTVLCIVVVYTILAAMTTCAQESTER